MKEFNFDFTPLEGADRAWSKVLPDKWTPAYAREPLRKCRSNRFFTASGSTSLADRPGRLDWGELQAILSRNDKPALLSDSKLVQAPQKGLDSLDLSHTAGG